MMIHSGVVSFTTWLPQYPQNRRMSKTRSQSRQFRDKKIPCPYQEMN
jgi:hypothetical protein